MLKSLRNNNYYTSYGSINSTNLSLSNKKKGDYYNINYICNSTGDSSVFKNKKNKVINMNKNNNDEIINTLRDFITNSTQDNLYFPTTRKDFVKININNNNNKEEEKENKNNYFYYINYNDTNNNDINNLNLINNNNLKSTRNKNNNKIKQNNKNKNINSKYNNYSNIIYSLYQSKIDIKSEILLKEKILKNLLINIQILLNKITSIKQKLDENIDEKNLLNSNTLSYYFKNEEINLWRNFKI